VKAGAWIVVAVAVAFPPVAGAQVAYFSTQRAFSLSTEGKAAQAELLALEAARARDIEGRNKALETQRLALERGATVLGDAARAQRTKEIQKFEIDLQRFIQDAQAELAGAQRDAESAFLARLRPALDQVAKEKGLALVFNADAGVLMWSDPALDITPEVVERLDAR
jgi:outer membrane protein